MAVTADQLINMGERGSIGGPVAATVILYQGTMVFTASGWLTDVTASGANRFAGIAKKQYDNSAGANGDIDAELFDEGVFVLTGSGFTQGTVGSLIYASDNYTVTTTSATNTLIGRCVEFISSTQIKVAIETVIDQ